ncbi:MAG: phosphatidylglycerol:prolipoprotein diacylglycerol transferase [Planctomycetota bacterium]|jgi:phosphatidylglycerol:prolipoprotein diacylglycerol transferase
MYTFFASIDFPDISPIIFELGPFALRWYALGYIAGIVLGWRYIYHLIGYKHTGMTKAHVDDIIVAVTFGIILGGRLGYVLFYKPGHYFENPSEIIQIWRGGMSFHGGLLGATTGIIFSSWRRKLRIGHVLDVCACAAPIGIFLVRIANFINGELYGRPTDVSWGVKFPRAIEPRHPSQIYEAFLEGFLLFGVLFFLARRPGIRNLPGRLSGLFLIGYGLSRFTVEFFREPDAHLGFIFGFLTMGQILSLPMIILGAWFAWRGMGRSHVAA